MIKGIKGKPQQPDPSRPGMSIPIKINFDPMVMMESEEKFEDQDAEKERQIRRMKITQEILRKYGYTKGCYSCRYKSVGFHENRAHNLESRTRIENSMMEDTVDREKWEKDNERINWRIAAQMEKSIGEKNGEETNHRDAAYEDQAAQG